MRYLWRLISLITLSLSVNILHAQSDSSNTLNRSDFDVFVGNSDDVLIAIPSQLIRMSSDQFAVYDREQYKIMVFNTNGDLQYSFGRSGKGPGEWSGSGATDIAYEDDTFMANNDGNYSLEYYSGPGEHLKSLHYSEDLYLNPKHFLSDGQLIIGTFGKGGALAEIISTENELLTVRSFGEPVSEYEGFTRSLYEIERQEYASGKIPPRDANRVMIGSTDDKIFLLLNTQAEIRVFDHSGNLLSSFDLPDKILQSLKAVVTERNENTSRNTVVPLDYAIAFDVSDDKIAVLTGTFGPEHPEIRQHILLYDLNGNLSADYIIDNSQDLYLGEIMLLDEKVYVSDVVRSQILSYQID